MKRLIATLILLAAAVSTPAADKVANPPKRAPIDYGSGEAWVVTTNLEITGAAFPTLPEPYVSVKLSTVAALDGAPVTAEARTVTNQRVTLSVAEAQALRDALDAWLADPTTTVTLAAKSY